MAQAIPAIVAIVGLAASAYSAYQQADAADEAKEIAEMNADRERAESAEEARRAQKQADRTNSLARARAAASGIAGESSDMYLAALEDEQQREVDWIRTSGSSRAKIIEKEGRRAHKIGNAEAWSTMASGVQDSYSWYQTYK